MRYQQRDFDFSDTNTIGQLDQPPQGPQRNVLNPGQGRQSIFINRHTPRFRHMSVAVSADKALQCYRISKSVHTFLRHVRLALILFFFGQVYQLI